MTDTDYSGMRRRNRIIGASAGFGAGVITGDSDTSSAGMMNKIRENMQFRVDSLTDMLMGGGESNMSPLERRSKIRQRRREMLGIGDSSDEASSDTSSSIGRRTSRGSTSSGSISTSTTTHGGGVNNEQSSTPLMSEVDRGTKARAEDRGFQG